MTDTLRIGQGVLSENKKEQLQPTPYEYLPFGAGPRMCIGVGFATLALRLVLAMIVQRFRLTLAQGARISRHVRGPNFGPKHGLPMLLGLQDGRFVRRARAGGTFTSSSIGRPEHAVVQGARTPELLAQASLHMEAHGSAHAPHVH